MAETMNKTIQVCKDCGSDDVERKMWENQKTGELSDASFDDDDNFCNKCEEHTPIEFKEVTEKEYQKMLRDKPRFQKAVESLRDCVEYMDDDNFPAKRLLSRKNLITLCNKIAIKYGGCISTRQF